MIAATDDRESAAAAAERRGREGEETGRPVPLEPVSRETTCFMAADHLHQSADCQSATNAPTSDAAAGNEALRTIE